MHNLPVRKHSVKIKTKKSLENFHLSNERLGGDYSLSCRESTLVTFCCPGR